MAFSFNISFDLTDNSPIFQAAMEQGVRKAVKMIGMQAERNVKAITPVGTPESTGKPGYIGGTLRGSITHESDSDTAYIGTDVKYAPYVEFGTYKMAAQPYLKPGIMDHVDEYEQIAHDAIESCMP